MASAHSSHSRPHLRAHASSDVSNGHLDLDTRLDRDGRDLLDDIRGGVEVDETLVDAHLPAIPSVCSLAAGCLTDCEVEHFGGEPDRAGDMKLLLASAGNEVSTDLLQ